MDALNPVTFNWIDPNQGATPQLGFIAQQVQQVFPNLISTTIATALTPGGTLGLNYIGLISPIVSAIQALSAEIASIETTIAGFAQSITTHQINADELASTAPASRRRNSPPCSPARELAADTGSSSSAERNGSPTTLDLRPDSTDTPPVIQINGDNPAIIQVGATYTDLGATITGPQQDLNLGIQTFVNGAPMSPIEIDTSTAATDTIDYVVTDQTGLTATSTRSVVIEPAKSTTTSQDQPSALTTSTTTQ